MAVEATKLAAEPPQRSVRGYDEDGLKHEVDAAVAEGMKAREVAERACKENDFAMVQYLLESGAVSIDEPVDGYGNRIAHYAALKRNVGALRMALIAGADVNMCNDDGSSVVRSAAVGGCAEVVAVLLAAGADPNVGSDSGSTPLHQAVDRGFAGVVKVLLDGGGDHNKCDKAGRTPLMVALSKWQGHTLEAAAASVDLMIDAGSIDWTQRDGEANSILHFACQNGKLASIVDVLPTLSPSAFEANASGETLLHAAVTNADNSRWLAALTSLPLLDPCARDAAGNTVLHRIFATRADEPDQRVAGMLDALFSVYGARLDALVNEFNADGVTALLLALTNDAVPDALQILVDHGADVGLEPLRGAKYPSTGANSRKLSPLLYAIKHKHVAVVEVLLTAPGLDPDAVTVRGSGRTALHVAVKTGDVAKVGALLDSGADMFRADKAGKTPSDLARKAEVVALLEKRGGRKRPRTDDETLPPRKEAALPPWKRRKYRQLAPAAAAPEPVAAEDEAGAGAP
ncbi:ankyrin domain-containing protein [Thecamonas trahens ATCC 50062]|uniref:Ankyrin domain-containing protein n=1 Tax=Thecamonas trahens ATCC 50062 TaxID=461836 RepID=A0A0L0D6L2_THETB|nr:ankyrin domain-containing protein [Thecamonas trahens ATCC 50062]KNC47716.1 ankyrin domain-containing protein [Thecamonas trahens ATCC 50062]|eukprot:XP_013759198.1 ankyrin domain-containing protein [Thecamonas trahens ATCC 50062]